MLDASLPILKHVTFDIHGRPSLYDDEARKAMRLVEALLDAKAVALGPDMWLGGKLSFLPPHVAARNRQKQAEARAAECGNVM